MTCFRLCQPAKRRLKRTVPRFSMERRSCGVGAQFVWLSVQTSWKNRSHLSICQFWRLLLWNNNSLLVGWSVSSRNNSWGPSAHRELSSQFSAIIIKSNTCFARTLGTRWSSPKNTNPMWPRAMQQVGSCPWLLESGFQAGIKRLQSCSFSFPAWHQACVVGGRAQSRVRWTVKCSLPCGQKRWTQSFA